MVMNMTKTTAIEINLLALFCCLAIKHLQSLTITYSIDLELRFKSSAIALRIEIKIISYSIHLELRFKSSAIAFT